MDPVKILPTEVFEQILSYLNLQELMSCCLVSQKWNIAANNDYLWKELCLANNWQDCGCFKEKVSEFGFLTADEKTAFLNMGEWKKHFVLKNQLQNNWREGNSKHFLIMPSGNEEVCRISSVNTDGNLLVLGLEDGLLNVFDLTEECKLIAIKECALPTPFTNIHILKDSIFVIQNRLFQTYKLTSNDEIEFTSAKSVTDTIINIDIPTLMLLDRNDRPFIIDNTDTSKYNTYWFTDNFLAFARFYSNTVDVYDLRCDFVEPKMSINLNLSSHTHFINCDFHINDGVLFVLIQEFDRIVIKAYSLRTETLILDQNIPESFSILFDEATLEINEFYIVVRSDDSFFILDRDTGSLLFRNTGLIFLNANSNPKLVGLLIEDTFQIIEPVTFNEYYCVTLEGLPIAVYFNVIVTNCVDYDSDGIGSTEVEFWNMKNAIQKISGFEFPSHSTVTLIHSDSTKLIFHAEREYCVVRNFIT